MAKIRNISGHDLIVPGLGGRLVTSGATVDVADDAADSYTVATSGMWAQADTSTESPVDSPADKAK